MKVPADGVLVEGSDVTCNESALTGEHDIHSGSWTLCGNDDGHDRYHDSDDSDVDDDDSDSDDSDDDDVDDDDDDDSDDDGGGNDDGYDDDSYR